MGERPNPWTFRDATPEGGERRGASPWQRSALRLCQAIDPQGRDLGGFFDRPKRTGSGRIKVGTLSTHAVGRARDWLASSPAKRRAIAAAFIERDAQDVQLIAVRGEQWGGRRGPGWRATRDYDSYGALQLHIESRDAHWSDA